jgi:hypothetical protein
VKGLDEMRPRASFILSPDKLSAILPAIVLEVHDMRTCKSFVNLSG